MKLAIASTLLATVAAFAPSSTSKSTSTVALQETKADLGDLAKKLNPIVPFFDPLSLADQEFWGQSNEATIGFLRESEVKHGRIAMFAFVGYIVHANHITWPWPMQMDGTPFPADTASPPEAWDAIPDSAKLQIFAFVGFLEFWREVSCEKHYMRGGKVGEFPAFDAKYIPGGALNLYDPFGFNKNNSEEKKAAGLIKEINNGRAAMLGIFGFLCAQTIPGSVPALSGVVPAYSGEVMAPLSKSILPF
eukprot:CAMPEP_0196802464 /NCGR_PEP_ID=MMETSP1362-20130617/2071_1 /TAXON_ID=163516 /ORGANISM="Leptocylindrus danicus, Strain CCMP1856" /LENGTH=247 /DNA_ID=CAMNT_0042173767 /DNA_START=13 /DNA_END=756 /DNA_ORIENTATION=+